MIGRPEHTEVNATLQRLLDERATLVLAHRGTAVGSVVENTAAAAEAAFRSGADAVEIDVTASSDGCWFAFHDGEELRQFGEPLDLRAMPAEAVEQLRYPFTDRLDRPARVERLTELLRCFRDRPDALFNVDRSWWHWPQLLPELDALRMSDRILLKSPVAGGHWKHLADHTEKYPYLGMCRTPGEVETVLAADGVNCVGVELLTGDDDSPFLDPGYLAGLRGRGAVTLVNAEVLSNGLPLFAGYDDERSVLGDLGAGDGWDHLLDLGVDIVQTDWPWLLRALVDQR